MKKCVATISAFLALLVFGDVGFAHAQAQAKLPAVDLSSGIYVIKAELASTASQQQQGLMFRDKMAENEGMLFVYGAPAKVCMWMKNTKLPLSVAFIDANGKIVNVEDMKPQTLTSHCSKGLVHYALEMNQGWFRQHNIGTGNVISGLPKGR